MRIYFDSIEIPTRSQSILLRSTVFRNAPTTGSFGYVWMDDSFWLITRVGCRLNGSIGLMSHHQWRATALVCQQRLTDCCVHMWYRWRWRYVIVILWMISRLYVYGCSIHENKFVIQGRRSKNNKYYVMGTGQWSLGCTWSEWLPPSCLEWAVQIWESHKRNHLHILRNVILAIQSISRAGALWPRSYNVTWWADSHEFKSQPQPKYIDPFLSDSST